MLSSIHIKNLAVVASAELEFSPGLTAMTGETGAGKSILIDALGLALGDRADNGMIRDGCDRAEITARFDLNENPDVIQWLREQELDSGDECLLRRVLVRNGSSRAYINASPVPVKMLQSLGALLVEIHGQHAHQSLLHRDHQRTLLDQYAAHHKLLEKTSGLYTRWRETEQRLEQLQAASRERSERIDLLRYQTNELEALALGENELDQLSEEHVRLSNAGRLLESSQLILSALYEDENASAQNSLNRAISELDELLALDGSLSGCREMLESAGIQIQEAVSELRQYSDGIELDPGRLQQVEDRLGEIHNLSRKYRCKPEALLEHLHQLTAELDALTHTDNQLSELQQAAETLKKAYLESADKLSNSRKKAARKLSSRVVEGMRSLGMPNGILEFQVESLPPEKAGPSGYDRVEILISTNPGQPPQPLSKVASGGELSRISLAIEVATLSCAQVPTLIFDEVDVGIGGGVAEIVGRLLRQLGNQYQVLCVTHLPQVAAQGHQHLRVSKRSNKAGVQTQITPLDEQQRIEEIARMLGGLDITAQTLAHAKEMLDRSQVPA